MKKKYLVLLCVVMILSSCAKPKEPLLPPTPTDTVKPASEVLDVPEGSVLFKVRNNIGADIYEIKIAPSGEEEYGEDILKSKILKMSESAEVSFLPTDSYSYWDLRALTENGNYYIWFNIQFGTFDEITLEIGDDGPVFTTN